MKRRLLILAGLAVATLPLIFQTARADQLAAPPDLVSEDRYLTNTVSVTLPGDLKTVRTAMDTTPITSFLEPTARIPPSKASPYLKVRGATLARSAVSTWLVGQRPSNAC